MKLIMASTSKFKTQILDRVGLKHTQLASNFYEESNFRDNVYQYVQDLSYGKAWDVCLSVTDGIILGLDTVVYANGEILEKPTDLEDVKRKIKLCANNTISVITGITLIHKGTNEIISDYAETKVKFRQIDDIDIEYYIENEPDMMYASGFVIENCMSNFIEKIEGSYYNILGVPVELIYQYLLRWGIHLKDLEQEVKIK